MQNSPFWQQFQTHQILSGHYAMDVIFPGRALDGEDEEVAANLGAVGQDLPVLPFFVIRSFDACVETLLRSWGTIWVAVALCSLSFFPRKKKLIALNKEDLYQKLLSSVLAIATARECQNFVSCRPVKSWKGKALAQACGAGILCSTARALT